MSFNNQPNTSFLMKYLCNIFFSLILFCTIPLNELITDFCKLKCNKHVNTVCRRKKYQCGAGPICPSGISSGFSAKERKLLLDEHNKKRELVASGNEKRGGMKSAANMAALTYSLELEFVAQCWTNNCKFAHDKCRRTSQFSKVGQNLYYATLNQNREQQIKKCIQAWYDEVANYPQGAIDTYQFAGNTGHFTQMVWAKTTHIGCGITLYSGKALIGCNYGPAGNMKDDALFVTGTPCSKCEGGLACGTIYKSLCGDPLPEVPFTPPFSVAYKASLSNMLLIMLSFVLPILCQI